MDVQRTTDSLRGQFLISTPVIESGFFKSTVTYICEHGEAGAMGIVINKPLVGLHKRTFDILLDRDHASSILSRGQQKVLSCILHLLSKEFIEKSLKTQPIVLIDDICSELDKENQYLILKYLNNMSTQAILTSIEKIALDPKFNVNLFHVEQKGDISNVKR